MDDFTVGLYITAGIGGLNITLFESLCCYTAKASSRNKPENHYLCVTVVHREPKDESEPSDGFYMKTALGPSHYRFQRN